MINFLKHTFAFNFFCCASMRPCGKIFSLLFAAALLFSVEAAEKPIYVVGYIADSETGEPISYAEVKTRSGKLLGKSNSRGRFEIEVEFKDAILVFTRAGFSSSELDLAEIGQLIDIEVLLESETKELPEKQIKGSRTVDKKKFKQQSIEELEQFQGMKIDLNDHLRSLEGVSGMTEYSSDISIFGGRTDDVSHYLGVSRIPNMRHLDFGYPGNQSVLNPRLLKSVSVEDNLYEGPLNQGNSSALQYNLKEGDKERITADIVFGTINREFNSTFYWGNTTYILSYRRLDPTFLANLGETFYTIPKDSRIPGSCYEDPNCKQLKEPIHARSEDFLVSVFNRDSLGGYNRFLMLGMSDVFDIKEDISTNFGETDVQIVQEGSQKNIFGTWEKLSVFPTGDMETGLSYNWGENRNYANDRSMVNLPWFYLASSKKPIMGLTTKTEQAFGTSFRWNPAEKIGDFNYSYGLELRYLMAGAAYRGHNALSIDVPDLDFLISNGMFRFGTRNGFSHLWENSVGWHSAEFDRIYPVASTRYTIPVRKKHNIYSDISLRQNTLTESIDSNSISPVTTSSAEVRIGMNGVFGKSMSFRGTLYSRYYLEPVLPVPEVYWHYKELNSADYAVVYGASLNLAWEPIHNFSANVNGSSVQGDYYLANGSNLIWEASRSLDLVSNIRILPRKDSLLSFILTYSVNNDIPLYEYRMPPDPDNNPEQSRSGRKDNHTRKVFQYGGTPFVSRQRTDARINLNLVSKWKPLETVKFFFQGNNLFSSADDPWLNWLGGKNQKQRGWTRLEPGNIGQLTPVLIRGVDFFWMFGFEMNFYI